jgi:hypothetical protein
MANSHTDVIAADALNVTKFTGFGSAVGGVMAATIAALGGAKGWPVPLQGALIGLAAVAVLVAGAVVVADMRTRAYLAARVLPKTDGGPAIPVLAEVWSDLSRIAPRLEEVALKLVEREPGAPQRAGSANGSSAPTIGDEDLRKVLVAAFLQLARRNPEEAVAALAGDVKANGSSRRSAAPRNRPRQG